MDTHSQTSINESQDMLDVSGFTNASPGPALVSNSSLEASPKLPAEVALASHHDDDVAVQRPSLAGTITASDLIASEPVAAVRDVADDSDAPADSSQVPETEAAHLSDTFTRGVAAPAGILSQSGDVIRGTGPSVSEAEAFADNLTRELLNDTSNLVRSTGHSGEEANAALVARTSEEELASAADELVDSAIVEATESLAASRRASQQVPETKHTADEQKQTDEEEQTGRNDGLASSSASAPASELTSEGTGQPIDSKPIVKEEKKVSVAIGPVTYEYTADSLDESQIEADNEEVQKRDELAADKVESAKVTKEAKEKLEEEEQQSPAEEVQKMDLELKSSESERAARKEETGEQRQQQRTDHVENVRVAFEQDEEEIVAQTAASSELESKKTAQELTEEIAAAGEGSEQQHHQPTTAAEAEEDTRTRLQDITTSELLQQTFRTAFNVSQEEDSQDERDKHNDDNYTKDGDNMEFTKNYSDDLLMGAGEQARPGANNNESGGPDLADFELPPYSGGSSSSGSEQAGAKQQSPIKKRDTSSKAATQASSSSRAPSDLTAVKNILISSYSKFGHVFHWKRPIESGIIFGAGLTLIAALTFFSIISVVAYSALGVVLASGLIRLYKTCMKTLNRSTETPVDHIWEKVLSLNVSMSPERMHELIDSSHANLNASLVYFKQVLLVEDKVATFKFFLFLYSLTYIGAWFNGLTLITILYVSIFTAPIVYEKNKTKIDEYLNLATSQLSYAISMVTGKVSALVGGGQSSSSAKKQN